LTLFTVVLSTRVPPVHVLTASRANLLLIVAVTALLFLVYSLGNMERLGIGLTHPRILVELSIVLLSLLGWLLLRR